MQEKAEKRGIGIVSLFTTYVLFRDWQLWKRILVD
jgi:hypothetical protein